MKFGDPKPTTSENLSSHDIETLDREAPLQLDPFLRAKINKLLQLGTEQTDKKQFIIDQIEIYRETTFQERGDLLDTILAKIEETNYDTDAEFEKNIAGKLTQVIVAYLKSHNISWKKAKINFRIGEIERDGDIPLDKDGVTYCSRYDDVVEVHITEGLTPTIWTEALSNLLKIIQDDQDIKTIRMASWFVAEKLSDFKKLGFTVSEITEEEMVIIRAHLDESMRDKANVPWAKAEMTREEFLNSKILKRISRK